MSPSRGIRAGIVLVLVLATAACSASAEARPDRTRRPKPTASAVIASPSASTSPSASPHSASIPVRRALAYSGAASAAQPPVKLTAGIYRAEWSATGSNGLCVFRARLDPLDGGSPYVMPEGQAPNGVTIQGGAELEISAGAYEVQVVARACRWKLNVNPAAESTG